MTPSDEPNAQDASPARAVAAPAFSSFQTGFAVVGASLLASLATFLILTNRTPIRPTNEVVLWSLATNALFVIAMTAVTIWQVRALWIARRHKAAGSRLHLHIVSLLSVIALLPAIVLLFASLSLDRGLTELFSVRTKAIIQNSLEVSEAYLDEAGQVIRSDIVAMGKDLDDEADKVRTNPRRFQEILLSQATLRDLPYAYLVDEQGKVLAAATEPSMADFVPPPASALAEAKQGQAVTISPGRLSRVGALLKLQRFRDTYLYVARQVNPSVLRHLERTKDGVKVYQQLEQSRTNYQRTFGMMYAVIALTLLMAAIQIGLWFAGRMVGPIRRLIGAAEQVSAGNLNVVLPVIKGEGDLRRLSSTFNRMTADLRAKQDELIAAHEEAFARRRFIEAVLSGVTAGVIGLDNSGKVMLANRSAERLLGRSGAGLVGTQLSVAVPEFAGLMNDAAADRKKTRLQGQAKLMVGDDERSFALQLTRQRAGADDAGSVVTFDDITELVSAQRTSAWADVARRIAHEIKNPLTPIQLSAERLKRKYGKAIIEDRETFDKLTDTIVRQVGDIKSMVDEFASFARMPKPEMAEHDLREVVKEPVFLFQMGQSGQIDFEIKLPPTPVMVSCDRRLISQAITNLVKNAGEAIGAVADAKDADPAYRGHISTLMQSSETGIVIEVIDNGVGLPKQNRARLLEPYVTTRAKGTGLGLAIVQKIIEQHGGKLTLEDAPARQGVAQRGAMVRIELPPGAHCAGAESQRASHGNGAASPGLRPSTSKRTAAAADPAAGSG